MNRFDAHGMFCLRPDGGHALLTPEIDAELAPLLCAGLASISGRLHECQNQDDLDDAVDHGLSLLRGGIVDNNDLLAEERAILAEVEQWGSEAESQCN